MDWYLLDLNAVREDWYHLDHHRHVDGDDDDDWVVECRLLESIQYFERTYSIDRSFHRRVGVNLVEDDPMDHRRIHPHLQIPIE